MSPTPLTGTKIAVLMESLFIPGEIDAYRTAFGERGAEVHLVTRLWGAPTIRFVSDPDGLADDGKSLKPHRVIDVDRDFGSVDVRDYAVVIIPANYVSVRLRYFEPPEGPRDAPAVRFFAEAMADPAVVKGALCHGLWILTPRPELLRGRRVVCHEVVRADVQNAGGIYVASADDVVVDDDLVTGRTWHQVGRFIEAVTERVLCSQRLYPRRKE